MREVPPRIHRAEVVRVVDLVPALRRVVLGGPGLADFESTGVGDECLRLFLPAGEDPAPVRTYTVRDWDPAARELTIDVVLHEGGVAAAWARAVRPGAAVEVSSPTGMYDAPDDLDWQLLVTDLTGLAAATRILRQTSPSVRSRLVVEVPSLAQCHDAELPAGVDVRWIVGGNGVAPSRIDQVVRSADRPEGVGYIWVAGETSVLRAVRRHLRHELGLPATAYKIVAYWREDAEEWNARFAALDPAVLEGLLALWDPDRDPEEMEDEWSARLAELGL